VFVGSAAGLRGHPVRFALVSSNPSYDTE
jgi:hypothetical protein